MLAPQDGRAAFFNDWADDIRVFDKQNWLERVLVYWALTEKYVEFCFAEYKVPDIIMSYEEIVQKEGELLWELSQVGLGSSSFRPLNLDKNSPTTVKSRRSISTESRLFGWKKELTTRVIDIIVDIVEHFDLSERLYCV